MIEYIYQLVPIPDAVKRSPHLLFFTIGGQILRCFLQARCTLLVLLAVAVATIARVFTPFWDWGSFDGYAVVFGLVSFYVGFPLGQVLEEFFHAAVPVAKSRPEWLKGMLVANLYAGDKKTIWLFMFVAIQHQGNWSPLDSFHISAGGPLGILIVTGLCFVVILAYRLLSDASILYPSLALSPFLVNGLLSLIPVRAVFRSDGANMVAMARQLELGPLQFLKESLRSVGLIANYLGQHTLAGIRIRRVLLLSIVVACVLLLSAS